MPYYSKLGHISTSITTTTTTTMATWCCQRLLISPWRHIIVFSTRGYLCPTWNIRHLAIWQFHSIYIIYLWEPMCLCHIQAKYYLSPTHVLMLLLLITQQHTQRYLILLNRKLRFLCFNNNSSSHFARVILFGGRERSCVGRYIYI